jgi:hypothetical protein
MKEMRNNYEFRRIFATQIPETCNKSGFESVSLLKKESLLTKKLLSENGRNGSEHLLFIVGNYGKP